MYTRDICIYPKVMHNEKPLVGKQVVFNCEF